MKLTRELGNPFKPIIGKYGNYEIYEDGKTAQLKSCEAQIPAIEEEAHKKGYEEAWESYLAMYKVDVVAIKRAAMERVLVWLFENSTAQEVDFPPKIISFTTTFEQWQKKLKELGLDKCQALKSELLGKGDEG